MSKNIKQVYDTNPITSNATTDLMYFGQSPYGAGNDAAMLYSSFLSQLNVMFPNGSVTVTSGSQTIANGTIYLNNPSLSHCVYTLPSTAAVGTFFGVVGLGASFGWRINVGTGQSLIVGNVNCTISTGSFSSQGNVDTVWFECIVANTIWRAVSVIGNPTNDAGLVANALNVNSNNPLSLAQGGTGSSLTASNGAIPYSNVGELVLLSPGTTGQLLQTNGVAAPSWTTATYPSTTTVNQLLYSSANNVVAGLTSQANSFLVTDSGGAPSLQNAATTRPLLGVPGLAVNNAFTAQNGITPVAITSTSGATGWNLNSAPNATYAAVENSTLGAATNQIAGNVYTLQFVQNASSAKTFAFNSNFKFPQGVAPIVSTGLSAVDIFSFYSNGTNMYCIGIAQNIS